MNDNTRFLCFLVDCQWGNWSEWTPCSQTCEINSQKGSQSRQKAIVRQATKGGTICVGDATELQDCPGAPCQGNN